MSQVSSFASGVVPPGTGVLQVYTATDGTTVPPNGAGTIIIDGAGGIDVTGAGNTVIITNTLAGSQYDCDTGSAIPVGGVLSVVGSPIQTRTIGAANEIIVELTDDVTVLRDISATRDVFAGRNILSGGSISAGDGLLALAGGLNSTGEVELHDPSLLNGVLQIDGDGNVYSEAGEAGTFLISPGIAGLPEWKTIIPGPTGTIAIAYDAGTGNITIDANETGDPIFQAKDTTQAHTVANVIVLTGDDNIRSTANPLPSNVITFSLADDVDIVHDLTVGNDIRVTGGDIIVADGGVSAKNDIVSTEGDIEAELGLLSRTGNIIASIGNIEATGSADEGGNIVAKRDIISQTGDISAVGGNIGCHGQFLAEGFEGTGLNITGATILHDPFTGILQVNHEAGGIVSSSNGDDGKILRAQGAGNLPRWNTLVAGANITIDTNDPSYPDSILISSTGGGGGMFGFSAYLTLAAIRVTGNGHIAFPKPLTTEFDNTGGAFDAANAEFVVPAGRSGLYHFTWNANIYNETSAAPKDYYGVISIHTSLPPPRSTYSAMYSGTGYSYHNNSYTALFSADIYLPEGARALFSVQEVLGGGFVTSIRGGTYTKISGFLAST